MPHRQGDALNRLVRGAAYLAALLLFVTCAEPAAGDYVSDRQAAVALVRSGQHAEALAEYLRMAEYAVGDVQKCDALEQAAQCALALQQYDRAMDLARQIPLAPQSQTCQMLVLESERKWPEIVDRFQDAPIDRWPDSVQGEAWFRRGYAYLALKNGPAAVNDLARAAEYLTNGNSLGLCLNHLGDGYATLLQDDEQAIEAYRRTYHTGNVYKHCQAAISISGILLRRQQPAAAIEELGKIDLEHVTAPYWRAAMLRSLGQALAAAGDKPAAIARYEEALHIADLPAGVKTECEAALVQLRGAQ